MNKSNVRKLALAILNGTLATRERGTKIGFNMIPWFSKEGEESTNYEDKTGYNCGTVACMAGWAYFLSGGSFRKAVLNSRDGSHIIERARKYLGLDPPTASNLFVPDYVLRKNTTTKDAALVLFNLVETGKVDWNIVERQ
jgi:hypothetical protein